MTLLEFSKRFPTEKSCRLDFKSVRDKQGVQGQMNIGMLISLILQHATM